MEDGRNVVGDAQSSCSMGGGWGLVWTLHVQEIGIEPILTAVGWSIYLSLGYTDYASQNILSSRQASQPVSQPYINTRPFFEPIFLLHS